jgi:transcriptional regulator with XRE-family HTH domain
MAGNRSFAGRLRELRESAGLTQVELAAKAGMHRFGVAKLEQGVREPSWATVQALAEALGVDCRAFVGPADGGEHQARQRGRPRKAEAAPQAPAPKRPTRRRSK